MATTLARPVAGGLRRNSSKRPLSKEDADRAGQTLHLAEELGAETATISGAHLVDELLDYARRRNMTKIMVGKPQRPRWQEWLSGSVVYELTRKCGDIDVYVISGDVDEPVKTGRRAAPTRLHPLAYLGALFAITACTGAGWLMQGRLALANIIMVYLLGVITVAVQFGRGPSILASILGVAAFDFFFVPPTMTFAVSDTQYLLTFAVMLITGLIISTLTAHVKFQAESAQMREATAALYAMSRGLVEATTTQALVDLAVKHIAEVFDGEVFLLFPDASTARTSDDHAGSFLFVLGRANGP